MNGILFSYYYVLRYPTVPSTFDNSLNYDSFVYSFFPQAVASKVSMLYKALNENVKPVTCVGGRASASHKHPTIFKCQR